MKASEAGSSATGSSTASSTSDCHRSQSHGGSFAKVLDGRKQPIRGLWVRNGRYYAQLRIENTVTGIKKTRRIPLVDKEAKAVETVAQAVAELKRLQTQRSDDTLPVLERTPKFADYVKRYTDFISSGQGAKKPGTVAKEKAILTRWVDSIGQLRINQIKRIHVNRFIETRLKEDAASRTINLDVIAFRVVMKRALSDGIIQRLPTEGLRPLKSITKQRRLVETHDLDALCQAAFQTKETPAGAVPLTKNALQFADYIRLMAYSGARRNEALGIQWDDVDFKNGLLHLRRQNTVRGIEALKNSEERAVDFNPKLRAHLLDMQRRAAPDPDRGTASKWLFPSPQRGEKDIPAKTFMESLKLARAAAKMPSLGFHDCRHHFISMCVMSGIDFMTVAAWVGHKDGGVLIGKVYGHLANEHRQRMADKLKFEPTIVEREESAA